MSFSQGGIVGFVLNFMIRLNCQLIRNIASIKILGLRSGQFFCMHFNQNINIKKRKESKVTVNIISNENIGMIVLITNE